MSTRSVFKHTHGSDRGGLSTSQHHVEIVDHQPNTTSVEYRKRAKTMDPTAGARACGDRPRVEPFRVADRQRGADRRRRSVIGFRKGSDDGFDEQGCRSGSSDTSGCACRCGHSDRVDLDRIVRRTRLWPQGRGHARRALRLMSAVRAP
jgi:hypothetical protein